MRHVDKVGCHFFVSIPSYTWNINHMNSNIGYHKSCCIIGTSAKMFGSKCTYINFLVLVNV